MGSERRKYTRTPLKLAVQLSWKAQETAAFILDIGVGGAQLQSDLDLPLGQTVFIRFDPAWPLGGFKGCVAWKAPGGRVGVQFLEMGEGQKVLTVDRVIRLAAQTDSRMQ